ncbi:hypothetical protein BDB01DRAFT_804602 [Pilobolus umbonatus]|nr:hypothetical protein BDB01DRAFT_804602 [Pilobolus umbonatus]
MDNQTPDIHQDSGRYLQEYVQSLENLPSEIRYHWAEIRNRYDQAKAPERRIKSGQHDLATLHRHWFNHELDKREKLLKQQPAIIKRIQSDYNKLEDLANERISLAEEALKLVDKHLIKLQHDLDNHDRDHPELAPPLQTRPFSVYQSRKNHDSDFDDDIGDDTEDREQGEATDEFEFVDNKLEQPDYQKMIANRNQKRKKKEAREADKSEPLYCFCQQVSYGEMVACDGEHCAYEWFHMDCVGLDEPPKGAWYCDDCAADIRKRKNTDTIHSQLINRKMKRKKESHI